MTDIHNLSSDDEVEALAAEYVLGVLVLDERLAAQKRIKSDPKFAVAVQKWETHFAGLNDNFTAVPAPDLLPAIEARLFGKPAVPKRNWWGLLAGAGVAAAIAVAAFVALLPFGPSGPVLTASLVAEAQDLAFDASYSDGTLTLIRVSGGEAAAGRDYELWLIDGGAAPVSLGLITDATSSRALANLHPGAVLAVSLEKMGGSTSGAPDQVLLTGAVATL